MIATDEALQVSETPHIDPDLSEPEEEEWSEPGGIGSRYNEPRFIVTDKTANFLQCVDHNRGLLTSSGSFSPDLRVTIREGFPSSFRPQVKGLASELTNETQTGSREGIGTRVRLQFDNVGAGVNLFVPVDVDLRGSLPGVSSTVPSGLQTGRMTLVTPDSKMRERSASSFASARGPGIEQLTVTRGTADATYEVMESNPNYLHEATINVFVAFISNTGQDLPATGTTLISIAVSEPNDPIPGFRDASKSRNLFSINSCTSAVLFPFVTNQAGLDTRIALANTSLDPFGSVPQQGPVILNYYGSAVDGGAAPPPFKTRTVPAGQELIFTLSSGGNFGVPATPGFQGYIIAVACFQPCHAVALISGEGVQTTSQCYLAIQLRRFNRPVRPV